MNNCLGSLFFLSFCSVLFFATQVPGYLESQDALKEAGIDEVIVYCVNDGAVMTAWGKDQGIEDSMVKFFGDPSGEFTKAVDMEMTHPGPVSVGIIGRCKRWAMHVVDGEVKGVAVAESEFDPAGDDFPEKTLAAALIEMAKVSEEA
jgi:2-Cys peroxiredoxin 5